MSTYSVDGLTLAAARAGFPSDKSTIAAAIAMAESSGDSSKVAHEPDGSTSYGLWQINSSHPDILKTGDWANIDDNAKMAYAVYQRQGFNAWTTYTQPVGKPAYLRYLPGVSIGNHAVTSAPGTTSTPNLVTSATSGLTSGFNAITSQLSKIGGNFASVAIIVVFLVLGVVLLMHSQVGTAVKIATKI